ncbi:hypothetical protein BDN71DRAFT_1449790 [Pleurotus eryngii]|uniref:Uncharacterized protein n=1 Tax=Pleurotus eryngii TaxID=5323 RepID=A0A9P6D5R1_PLEER|nr:hypothetical protein BDN71DRAFT_1449790 [Pleurotus eryngii]
MGERPSTKYPSSKDECRIAELLQYTCDHTVSEGRPLVHCFPIPRMFRLCQGKPAVEITRFVQVDLNTGEVELPPKPGKVIPEGRPWREIRRYEGSSA